MYDFQLFQGIKHFDDSTYNSKIATVKLMKKNNLLQNILEFNKKVRPRSKEKKRSKKRKSILLKV